jgi:predicted small metal-binding protein
MDPVRQFTNRCACGWEFRGTLDAVVDATIDHGERIHNMKATREQVVAALEAEAPSPAETGPEARARPTEATPTEGAAGG